MNYTKMNENVILRLMIIRLEQILPLKEFKFIEEESYKLIKPFENECAIVS